MKALILSGGKGSRLRPITNTTAKQLLPVANVPIIFRAIDSIVEAGIVDIIIIVSPETGKEVKEAIDKEYQDRHFFSFITQDQPLGLAHAVKIAQPLIGDEDFLMFLGDNLIQEPLLRFIQDLDYNCSSANVVLKEVEDPSSFGVAEVSTLTGGILRLEEKPKEPKTNLALVGLYIFTSDIFEAIDKIKPSKRGELEITDAIQQLVTDGKYVSSSIMDGWWLDTGKKDDMLKANYTVLDEIKEANFHKNKAQTNQISGRVVIHPGASLTCCKITGPAIIGDSCLTNTVIGPFTSIGNNVIIRNSEIQESIVYDGATIYDVGPIKNSIIGKNATIEANEKHYSFMIGDDNKVEV